MARLTKWEKAFPLIEEYLDKNASTRSVFTTKALFELLARNRDNWDLSGAITGKKFIALLERESHLERIQFKSPKYGDKVRYSWREVSDYALASAFVPSGFFCYLTAMFLYELTLLVPETLFINSEQTPKKMLLPLLTQNQLTLAFKNNPRMSNLVYRFRKKKLCIVSGKNTGRLAVVEATAGTGERVSVTSLERTLIDIAVRPHYSGGVREVLSAYKAANGRASTNELFAILTSLQYVYPYHQAVGFYMARAGFPGEALDIIRQPGIKLDFYLEHGMQEVDFDQEWRVFIPKGL